MAHQHSYLERRRGIDGLAAIVDFPAGKRSVLRPAIEGHRKRRERRGCLIDGMFDDRTDDTALAESRLNGIEDRRKALGKLILWHGLKHPTG